MRRLLFLAKALLELAMSALIGRLTPSHGIQALEASLAGSVGAIVGGVIAALAFSFVVLAQLFKSAANGEESVRLRYRSVTQSLLADAVLLVWCLAGAIFFPVLRHINVPLIVYPADITAYLTRDQLVTSLEVLVVIASISILLEVCHCMFQTFIADSLHQKKP